MGGTVIGMGKHDQTTRITFRPMEWVAIATLLITALCFLGGGVAVYREHDRDITTLKADNQTLKAMVAELQADAKVVRSDVAEVKALMLRRASAEELERQRIASGRILMEVGQ